MRGRDEPQVCCCYLEAVMGTCESQACSLGKGGHAGNEDIFLPYLDKIKYCIRFISSAITVGANIQRVFMSAHSPHVH